MRRTYTLWLTFLTLLLVPVTTAWGQLNNYYFAYSTGDPISMDGSSTLYQGSVGISTDDGFWGFSCPFPFKFNGVTYNSFVGSANGVLYPGSTSPGSDWTNNLTSAPRYPLLAPFWYDMRISGGSQGCTAPLFHWVVKGVAPNRILVVEYRQFQLTRYMYGQNPATFQVRLYEGTNKIEFWYGEMNNCDVCNFSNSCYTTYATVGIAASSSQFISVSFPGGTPTESRSSVNNSIDISSTKIAKNQLIVFGECAAMLNGRIGENNGGTATVEDGDTFFEGFQVQIGDQAIYRPFDIRMASPVCTAPYTLTITGPAAADYFFDTPGTQTVTRTLALGGEVHIPEITFKPTDAGLRQATLTVTGLGLTKTFKLAAYAPYVNYIGIIPQGGTEKMLSGDVLLEGKRVDRHNTDSYTPFTLTNVSLTDVPITYTITGGFGQYTISPGGPLAPGASTTPTITFEALGFGVQNATLQVQAGPETRTFPLAAISAAPGGEFRLGNRLLDTSSALFTNTYVCVGNEVNRLEVQMVNTGYGNFTIDGAEFYETDTAIQQGIPKFAFRRDAQGNLIPAKDYVVMVNNAPAQFPITLAEGQTQTLEITFTGTAPGKRYARGYLFTNSENTAAPDTAGAVHEGIVAFEVFGRGAGSRLSDNMNGGLPKAVIFPGARLGESSEATLMITNPGACTLQVSLPKMQITAGDVDEFSIVSKPNAPVDANQNLLIAPGTSQEVVLRFTPLQAGSRRASLRLATNDSTVHIDGVTERGVYYLDLYGSGGTDMYVQGIDFGQVLTDAPSQARHDVVRVMNTLSVPQTITAIEVVGDNASEFTEDASNPWPALPFVLKPGELTLGITFMPTGAAGDRMASLKLTTSTGFEVMAELKGVAGTRTMEVTPAAINFPGTTVGRFQRQMVTITNTGTMPMRVGQIEVTGADMANFQVGTLPQRDIEPGYSERVEVTFVPGAQGTPTATLVINGNATNAPGQVLLSGTAFKTKNPDDDDPSIPGRGVSDRDAVRNGLEHPEDGLSVSGVETATSVAGVTLYQSVPNPARDIVEISYSLVKGADVELGLYDVSGRLVRVLASGARSAGEQTVRVDVRDLASGTYYYRLSAHGRTLSRTLTITR